MAPGCLSLSGWSSLEPWRCLVGSLLSGEWLKGLFGAMQLWLLLQLVIIQSPRCLRNAQ